VADDLGVFAPKGLVEGQHVVLVAYYIAEAVQDQVAVGKSVAGADAVRSGDVAEAAERAGLS
jgi:hypothetical protein